HQTPYIKKPLLITTVVPVIALNGNVLLMFRMNHSLTTNKLFLP
ncbi:MAG: hypothetical protein ACI90V_012546, partial [Bacillariaceae sp.]